MADPKKGDNELKRCSVLGLNPESQI
ncbi:hypothetical protein OIU79_000431 [Salix purpurea]|uniref:Uncharacterized protein n=1 Tax=Salix purpurea TaxID=77065 RepID=A0A9Q0V1A0_SALPP|nr:hypothetical protein OIU79_000431 [Salix purpurea]